METACRTPGWTGWLVVTTWEQSLEHYKSVMLVDQSYPNAEKFARAIALYTRAVNEALFVGATSEAALNLIDHANRWQRLGTVFRRQGNFRRD